VIERFPVRHEFIGKSIKTQNGFVSQFLFFYKSENVHKRAAGGIFLAETMAGIASEVPDEMPQ
jgi:hypothetical protein